MNKLQLLLCLSVLLTAQASMAEDVAQTKDTSKKATLGLTVKVNKEAPRVLTIVPWRLQEKNVTTPSVTPVWQPEPKPLSLSGLERELQIFRQRQNNQNVNQTLDSE
ncbi:MAG: hypothetical protein D6694_07245 [Gammaproteobacteria bacterium]|nr:MAG: hypothetical protein D6694_07245 [Gammaproteobacteria bacterium]